ncbi:MAG: glycoside hydrolase family 1 protein [Chloroflexota bacterium]|nr:glycoside hydrolase family 1 protein [Chloroflexota bacterium]
MERSEALRFPNEFLWGTATSSHQVEGDNVENDWWAWEQTPGHVEDGTTSGRACDWWNRAEEDLDRAAALGQNAHRLSVEWSRVEPRQGAWDAAALARYREIIAHMRRRGMEPMVTLHHFTNPLWLEERGSWENEEAIALFDRFVVQVVEALGDLVSLWCTINEPNVYAYMSWADGVWPPGKQDIFTAFKVMRYLVRAHVATYCSIHRIQPHAQVGIAHHLRPFDPLRPGSALDRLAASLQNRVFNDAVFEGMCSGRLIIPLGRGRVPEAGDENEFMDFVGLNYYTHEVVTFDLRRGGELFGRRLVRDGVELNLFGEEIYPEGIYLCLKKLARYGKPIYITENGTSGHGDDRRRRYMLQHLAQVQRAAAEGVPVRGFFYWTLVDNFEWIKGWSTPFGLIHMDPATGERTPRLSAELYAEIARANVITREVVEKYAPALVGVVFGGNDNINSQSVI